MDFLHSLRTLLNEVCVFLDKEVLKTNLSEEVKSKAAQLIASAIIMRDRSVLQMSEQADGYTNMMKNSSLSSGSIKDEYIGPDMKPIYASEVDYSEADDGPSAESVAPVEMREKSDEYVKLTKLECPYQNALLNELKPIKEGTLMRKEYILHYVPINRVYIVVLLAEWLLFYNTNKKHKALESYALKSIKAKNTDEKGGAFIIEVDANTFTLTADSRKEKMQWIAALTDIHSVKPLESPADFLRHNSSDSDRHSDIYAAIDETLYEESAPDTPEYINTDSALPNPTLPPRSQSALPALPTLPTLSVLPGQALSEAYMYPPPPQTAPGGPEEDYQFLPPPKTTPKTTPKPVRAVTVNVPALPPPEEIYQFAAADGSQNPPEEIYDYAGHADPADYPTPDDIYESIEEPINSPSNRKTCMNMNNNQMAMATPPPKVPPPPSQTTMLNELKLKQKLYQQAKGQVGNVGHIGNANAHDESKMEAVDAETDRGSLKIERRKKSRLSFGIGSRKK